MYYEEDWTGIPNMISVAVEYDKVCNRKKDLRNKLVSKLTRQYDIIVCQDESIKGWHEGRYGKQN